MDVPVDACLEPMIRTNDSSTTNDVYNFHVHFSIN